MPRPVAVVLLSALAACGCALVAKKTPTPAAQIDRATLYRTPPPPGERYYGIVFGAEAPSRAPRLTHSWATLVKVTDRGPGCDPAIEPITISWLPNTFDFSPVDFYVQPASNFDLHTTLRGLLERGEEVEMWGPYEVSYPLYYRFTVHKQFLDSGAVGYQTIDTVGEAARKGNGCNCIHAVTDLDPEIGRTAYPLAFYGHNASWNMVRRVMRAGAIIDPPTTHDWLIPALELDQYPIQRKTFRGRMVPYEPPAGGFSAAGGVGGVGGVGCGPAVSPVEVVFGQ